MVKKIFKTENPINQKVELLSSTYYGHIKPQHEDISTNRIKNVVETPDLIVPDPEHTNRHNYYKLDSSKKKQPAHTKVVTENRNNINYVITAYTVPKVKGGSNVPIYHK